LKRGAAVGASKRDDDESEGVKVGTSSTVAGVSPTLVEG
jgi:hypothetical protein